MFIYIYTKGMVDAREGVAGSEQATGIDPAPSAWKLSQLMRCGGVSDA
jgi:hypothetical protein